MMMSRPDAAEGCGVGEPVEGRPLRIATTVAPITNIVANIAGGSGAEITGVVPEGTNSHTYEPAPSVAVTLEDADVVFVNGLMLEEPTKQLALANLASGAEVCELGTTVLPEGDTPTTSRSRRTAASRTRTCGPTRRWSPTTPG